MLEKSHSSDEMAIAWTNSNAKYKVHDQNDNTTDKMNDKEKCLEFHDGNWSN